MVTNMYPTPDRPYSGSFIKSQIDSIQKEGVEIEIVCIDAKTNRFDYIRGWYQIFKKSWDSGFDMIHAHYGYSGMVSRLQFKLPVMVSYCGGDVLGNPNEKGEKKFFDKIMLPLGWILSMVVQAAIVKSKEMKKRLPKGQNIFVIPNGVNMKLFKPIPKMSARNQIGLKPNTKYVLFAANPAWIRKNYPLAEKAVKMLQQMVKDVELLVLHSKSQKMVPTYINACDVMLLTSFWEGSPNVIKEAMACNLPIVSVDVGDVKEIIDGCESCYIADRNAGDLADKLQKVLIDTKRMNGREYIKTLEIQRVAKRIISLYRRTIKKGNR